MKEKKVHFDKRRIPLFMVRTINKKVMSTIFGYWEILYVAIVMYGQAYYARYIKFCEKEDYIEWQYEGHNIYRGKK